MKCHSKNPCRATKTYPIRSKFREAHLVSIKPFYILSIISICKKKMHNFKIIVPSQTDSLTQGMIQD